MLRGASYAAHVINTRSTNDMEDAKTYSNRNNARRAGVQAGVPSEQVELTVHKSLDGVRFGWKQKPPHATGAPVPDPVLTTVAKEAAPAPKAKQVQRARVERVEQNGVMRPAPGGLCAAVWEWLDSNPAATLADAKATAVDKGWNPNNAACELYQWRRFNRDPAKAEASAA
jgi:hypothetical protein